MYVSQLVCLHALYRWLRSDLVKEISLVSVVICLSLSSDGLGRNPLLIDQFAQWCHRSYISWQLTRYRRKFDRPLPFARLADRQVRPALQQPTLQKKVFDQSDSLAENYWLWFDQRGSNLVWICSRLLNRRSDPKVISLYLCASYSVVLWLASYRIFLDRLALLV